LQRLSSDPPLPRKHFPSTAVEFGHAPEALASDAGVVQIMVLFEQLIAWKFQAK
jgi:hypothetical protein